MGGLNINTIDLDANLSKRSSRDLNYVYCVLCATIAIASVANAHNLGVV